MFDTARLAYCVLVFGPAIGGVLDYFFGWKAICWALFYLGIAILVISFKWFDQFAISGFFGHFSHFFGLLQVFFVLLHFFLLFCSYFVLLGSHWSFLVILGRFRSFLFSEINSSTRILHVEFYDPGTVGSSRAPAGSYTVEF